MFSPSIFRCARRQRILTARTKVSSVVDTIQEMSRPSDILREASLALPRKGVRQVLASIRRREQELLKERGFNRATRRKLSRNLTLSLLS